MKKLVIGAVASALIFLSGCGAPSTNVTGTLNTSVDTEKIQVTKNNNANPCAAYYSAADAGADMGGTWISGGSGTITPAQNEDVAAHCSVTYVSKGGDGSTFYTLGIAVTTFHSAAAALQGLTDMQVVQESEAWSGPTIGSKTVVFKEMGRPTKKIVFVSGAHLVDVSHGAVSEKGESKASNDITKLAAVAVKVNAQLK